MGSDVSYILHPGKNSRAIILAENSATEKEIMFSTVITITDDTDLEYEVGFPVAQRDLGLWLNGLKLIDGSDFTFDQSINSVTLCCEIEVDDILHFRVLKDK